MNTIAELTHRYDNLNSLLTHRVELVAVGDTYAAELNQALKKIKNLQRKRSDGFFDGLVNKVGRLQWHLLFQPQPLIHNPLVHALAEQVRDAVRQVEPRLADNQILKELLYATNKVTENDPLSGEFIIESCSEIGETDCVVVTEKRNQQYLQNWLAPFKVDVLNVSDFVKLSNHFVQAYVVGPPRLHKASLFASPAARELTYIFADWFNNRALPVTPFTDAAEVPLDPTVRVFSVPQSAQLDPISDDLEEDCRDVETRPSFEPPIITRNLEDQGEDASVLASSLLLGGNYIVHLDDGEYIRTLNPNRDAGQQIEYTKPSRIRRGHILLLRTGEREDRSLYNASIEACSPGVRSTQEQWRSKLKSRIRILGLDVVEKALKNLELRAYRQARAWTDPHFIRPRYDSDFRRLLLWLCIEIEPTFSNANTLRRTLRQLVAQGSRIIEDAIARESLESLELNDHMYLNLEDGGLRRLLAARILEISPERILVPRSTARVPRPLGEL